MSKEYTEELEVRLSLANAWLQLWRKAHDAALFHRINVRLLKAYGDPDRLLDKALEAKNMQEGQGSVLEYLKRLESDLNAAIRRKSLVEVT